MQPHIDTSVSRGLERRRTGDDLREFIRSNTRIQKTDMTQKSVYISSCTNCATTSTWRHAFLHACTYHYRISMNSRGRLSVKRELVKIYDIQAKLCTTRKRSSLGTSTISSIFHWCITATNKQKWLKCQLANGRLEYRCSEHTRERNPIGKASWGVNVRMYENSLTIENCFLSVRVYL